MPDRFGECPLLVVDHTQAYPGDQVFRIRTQRTLKELDCLPVHLSFQAGLTEQAVGFDMFGIVAQDVLAVSNGFIQADAPNQLFDLCDIVLQPDLWHQNSSPSAIIWRSI